MVTVVDYGMGNLGSILNMFRRVGADAQLASDVAAIRQASKLLLPGVGAFDAAMKRIQELGFDKVLNDKVLGEGVPVLGICLGMQLLTSSSEEGELPGLGWIPGKTCAFKGRVDQEVKVPHMGWNVVKKAKGCSLIEDTVEEKRFYFVHSYFVQCDNRDHAAYTTEYGVVFDAMIQKEHIFGAQFHPEKSHKFGMKIFEHFARL